MLFRSNKVLTGRFIKFLDDQAEKDAEGYEKFFDQFGRFIKEGVITDYAHKDDLGKLLRYESSALEKGKRTSLADYVKRMPDFGGRAVGSTPAELGRIVATETAQWTKTARDADIKPE